MYEFCSVLNRQVHAGESLSRESGRGSGTQNPKKMENQGNINRLERNQKREPLWKERDEVEKQGLYISI